MKPKVGVKIVRAVDVALNMPEAEDGYCDILKALAQLMSENPNEVSQKAGRTSGGERL